MSIRTVTMFLGWTIAATAGAAAAPDQAVVRPGDATMSCEEIAAELVPYAQQIMPSVQAYGQSTAQLNQQSRVMNEQRRAQEQAVAALFMASSVDPTGATKRAGEVAAIAQQAKEKAENEALMNSPLAKQQKAQGDQMAAQAMQLQSNARLQRLMQLGQEKRCDKR